jgi:molecular chaperone GrpE
MQKKHWARTLKEENERLKEELASQKDKYLRALADIENFKKRMDRDFNARVDSAHQRLLGELIPVLGNLSRAIQPENAKKDNESFKKGVEMIYAQLMDVLEKEGLSPFGGKGDPFDPEFHEAISLVPSDDQTPGTVVDVFEQGYYYKGKVLRPAKVAVATPLKGDEEKEGASATHQQKGGN